MAERLVVDASVLVDVLAVTEGADAARTAMAGHELHAPSHLDAEVMSALGRLHRAGQLSARAVAGRLEMLAEAPIRRHLLPPLLAASWALRHNLSLLDAPYVALAEELDTVVLTADARLAAASPRARLVDI